MEQEKYRKVVEKGTFEFVAKEKPTKEKMTIPCELELISKDGKKRIFRFRSKYNGNKKGVILEVVYSDF